MIRIALWILKRAMKKDSDLAWAWHCNIAMVAQDSGASWIRANERTADFMRYVFEVSTIHQVRSLQKMHERKEVYI